MIIVLSTYPDKSSAQKAAADLVERRLAACVSIIPIECSVYRWKGKIEKRSERLLLIKTGKSAYSAVERRIKETHPHRVPEIVYVTVDRGNRDYLGWVETSTRLFRLPLDLRETMRDSAPSREHKRARKPRTLSR
jgi:periplasmic divalent cation tolerance protein